MIDTLLKDPRRRNLAILAAAAIVFVLLAVLAIHVKQGEVTPHYTEQSFFPDLVSHVRQIATIRVQSKRGTFDVTFKPYKGWVIPSHNDYPASYEQIKETMVGFAALLTIEPKTARAEWLHYVNLDAPPKGNGVEITFLDYKGHTLAAMIVGKSVDIGDPSGQIGLFVRKPDSDQSWLVKSPVEFKSDPADWMDKSVMDVDRARIAETDVDPIGTPPFDTRREKQSDPDFAVTDIPTGRELADPGAADAVATAISAFTFDDARPSKDFDFADAARLISHTFDGLIVTVETLKRDDGYWATVSAEAAPGKPDAAREAREIDAHAAGWAYKLPAAEGQLFMTTLESLLKPVGPAKPAPAP
ncbi:MAG TPA: DUF4340 domain-containing protein [Rhizomicrobium sp.]|jgi:hypothetical protein|nr:DUF4340 domain-containing protein [Rhizomicrobium sp.]